MYQYNRKGPKRGVALYSYSAEFGLEKCNVLRFYFLPIDGNRQFIDHGQKMSAII